MAIQKPNTTCRTCGKEYYACMSSKQLGGYKMIACSHECYQAYMREVLIARGEEVPDEFKQSKDEKVVNVESTVKIEDVEVELGIEEKLDSDKSKSKKKK